MHKNLYSVFKHWYRGGTVFFYSDTHFDDSEMPRPSSEEQVAKINSVLGKKDTIVFLGDVGNPEPIKKVRGYKVLIMGNHDKGASRYEEYFDEVYEGALTISNKLILSHEPINFPYALNIHGHNHARRYTDDMHYNVCAEFINYTPVPLKKIVESGLLKNVLDVHREAIDKQTTNLMRKLRKSANGR